MRDPRFGVGYRTPHADEIAAAPGAVDWLEVVSDGYIGVGGPRRARLERLRADLPLVLHGVGLSIGGSGPLDERYLRGLGELARELEPCFVSDHLCWTALFGRQSHDLLPLAYTAEVLEHVAGRVARVQDALGRPLVLENPTAYVAFSCDEMDEAEFFTHLCRTTGCGMLLDVNNLYVNSMNLGVDAVRYLARLPAAVAYMHLAGHAELADVRIDTHDAEVATAVWDLYDAAVRRFPSAGVIVERDDALPPYAELVAEVERARSRHRAARSQPPPAAAGPVRPEPARRRTGERWDALQQAFFGRLVDKPAGFAHADASALLDDSRPVTAARGMRVYSDAHAASLRRALATNFPALAAVIRSDDFERLAAAYLRAHPPTGHDFRRLGSELPGFVAGHRFAADYGVSRQALSDLVALQQAELEVQDAPDPQARVPTEALVRLDSERWDGVRCTFAECLRLVRVRFDVAAVIAAVAAGRDPERPEPAELVYRVFRCGNGVRTERLAPVEAALLEALLAGDRFVDACERAAAARGAPAAEAAAAGARVLVHATRYGLLTGLAEGDAGRRGGR